MRIRRDDGAGKLWREYYPDLSRGAPGLFGAVTSRAEAQVMRLGTIYALMDCSNMVTTNHLEAALAVWWYCRDSARAIFGDAVGDPVADQILGALRSAYPQGMTQTELSAVFSRHLRDGQLDRALRSLLELGLVRFEVEPTGGRPTHRWVALRVEK